MRFIVKNTTFLNPLDLIAPHSCRGCGRLGEPLCECCKNNLLQARPKSPQPKSTPPDFPPIYAVGYREGLLAILIHDYKYNSNRALAETFAELLDAILPSPTPTSPTPTPRTFIIPLPTASHHIRARALDHTQKIAKHLVDRRAHLKLSPLLLRAKNTVQVGADRTTRLHQAEEAYAINPAIKIDPSATYILLDDVYTTGASLTSAAKKLREAGAKNIIVAVLAISN